MAKFSEIIHKKVAFFPGTFDPFSLSHKQIVKEITNLGFDVYLTIDAFSWSKLTQPRMFRRNIVNLSISDELNVYLFPDNIPVNIANNRDLDYLKELFKDKELYIVVGSDVLVNASAYKSRPTKSSIHSLNHIIFLRANSETKQEDFKKAKEAQTRIKGKVINLKLPLQLEDISSSQIREHIDENRDISNLIDPLAQQYIYDYGLYLREPQYKSLIEAKSLKIEIIDNL
ncbi:MAG: cytidyltransferase, partial [Tissierellales bacterium]|nr:cytidyltransferase [Tissierellales bacterium]